MKKLFIVLFLLAFSVYGTATITSSTFTTVTENAIFYIAAQSGTGVQANYISIYVGYTKGDETSLDLTIGWMPDAYETWGSSTYYIVGERASDETMQPVTLKFDTTGNSYYRIKVPIGVSRMYVLTSYVSGSTGTMVLNARKER